MMWRGRHRGLPYDLDYAVMLPSDFIDKSDSDNGKLQSLVRPLARNESIPKRSKTA